MPEFDLKFELEEDIFFDLNQHDIEIKFIRENIEAGWTRVNFQYVENYELHAEIFVSDNFPEAEGIIGHF